MNAFAWGVAGSLVATILAGAWKLIALRLPTFIYPDFRGPWSISVKEGDIILTENARIKHQVLWWFSGEVRDSKDRSTRIAGRCFGSQIVTYTHAHPNPSKLIAVGSGVVVVDVLRRSAKGHAVFVGPKAGETEVPGQPTAAEVELVRPSDWPF